MQHRPLELYTVSPAPLRARPSVLKRQADDVLVAIAILGLVATISDGRADYREIDMFTREFRKRFALSRRQSLRLIGAALRRVRLAGNTNIIDCACDTLNTHLNSEQKLGLFDALGEILIADGIVQVSEEYFLDYIADRLNLVESLKEVYPKEVAARMN